MSIYIIIFTNKFNNTFYGRFFYVLSWNYSDGIFYYRYRIGISVLLHTHIEDDDSNDIFVCMIVHIEDRHVVLCQYYCSEVLSGKKLRKNIEIKVTIEIINNSA